MGFRKANGIKAKLTGMGTTALFCAVLFGCLALAGCSSSTVYYEDDEYVITNLVFEKENDAIPEMVGTIKNKNGISTEGFMATVTLLDKEGNEIARTIGLSGDTPANGEEKFSNCAYGR